MKAILLAGGKGSRLRPLTDSLPKPLLPVGGIPCIRHILRLLRTHGITEAAVTTGYLAEVLETALGQEAEGVSLTYFREDIPLGTAGGIVQTRNFIGEEDFVVVSGDAMCELDLTVAFEERRKKNALALLVLTRVPDPGEFGVVLTDEEGRITGFSEKPSLSGTFSDTVNTGIYVFSPAIFSHIPDGVSDFGRDVFPSLLRKGALLYGRVDHGYWCDIGDHRSYRLANLRLTGGKNVVGEGSRLPEKGVSGSVIGRNCRIGQGVRVEDAILGDGVTVEAEAVIGVGSVIGSGCRIGEGAVLSDGTVLESDTIVPAGAWLRTGGTGGFRETVRSYMEGDGIRCPLTVMSASLAVRLGSALAEAMGEGSVGGSRIGLMTDGHSDSERVRAALLRGIRAKGGEVVLLGQGFPAAASYAASAFGLTLSAFVGCEEGTMTMAIYDRFGLYPNRDRERKLLSLLATEGEASAEKPRPISERNALEEAYLPMLTKNRCALDGFSVTVARENGPSRLLTRALLAMGARFAGGGLKLSVSDNGYLLSAEQDGFTVDSVHIQAILLRYLIRDRVALPVTTPEAVLDLCRGRCELYTHCPTGESEDTARLLSLLHPELRHGAAAAMELVGLLAVSGRSLKDLCRHLPSFACRRADLVTEVEGCLGILPSVGAPAGDGVVATYAHGSVRVIPSRKGFRLTAEAASGEYAEEILSLSEREIRRLLGRS